ncbi:GntR family transcriptional regulator [Chachezhania sediminis]|uniref:GntR family transcriptional regulator n=1 Tax=Chachezhania sediminis TaxID=2599291 RepID=UPI00131D9DE6|nr:GntR family transcriptional regulator [Chachezhania sediminis]
MASVGQDDSRDDITPLQIEVMRGVVELIRDEGWAPGTRLSVPDLARRFGVSRSPVTVALGLLTERGIVAAMPAPHRGLQVAVDLRDMDVADIAPSSPLDDLYRRIMRDRASGDLPQDVSEAELIPRYDISRGVVRKLLMRFAAEGLAQRQPGHGWRFADSLDSMDGLRDSYEFRITVECAALRSPRFRINTGQLDSIRRMHRRILDGALQPTGEEWFRVNASFHEGLAAMSGNRFYRDAIHQQNALRRMQEAASFEELSADRIRESCEEHLAVLDAVEAGNMDWAEALLRQHLKQAAEY